MFVRYSVLYNNVTLHQTKLTAFILFMFILAVHILDRFTVCFLLYVFYCFIPLFSHILVLRLLGSSTYWHGCGAGSSIILDSNVVVIRGCMVVCGICGGWCFYLKCVLSLKLYFSTGGGWLPSRSATAYHLVLSFSHSCVFLVFSNFKINGWLWHDPH